MKKEKRYFLLTYMISFLIGCNQNPSISNKNKKPLRKVSRLREILGIQISSKSGDFVEQGSGLC
ncbi:hypothetical protein D1818_06975 [Aquimarina sp. BL5]|nr:hypothetical protein D1818_06975 [Aquimarina sp. BL5]